MFVYLFVPLWECTVYNPDWKMTERYFRSNEKSMFSMIWKHYCQKLSTKTWRLTYMQTWQATHFQWVSFFVMIWSPEPQHKSGPQARNTARSACFQLVYLTTDWFYCKRKWRNKQIYKTNTSCFISTNKQMLPIAIGSVNLC